MLTFRRQPSTLPMACSLLPGVLSPDQERVYLQDGPVDARRLGDDGGGILQLVADGAPVTIAIPPGSTWVEVAPLSDDDELDAHAEAGPPELYGSELAQAIDAARQSWLKAGRRGVEEALDGWSAEHRVRLTVAPDPEDRELGAADRERATEVRIRAARAALLHLVERSSAWPGIAARARLLRKLADEAPESPLTRAVRDLLDGVPAFMASSDLSHDAREALRRFHAHDRRLAAALARRGLRCVHHPELAGLDAQAAWARIEGAPHEVRAPFVAELYAHINRLGYASPKAAPAQSPASG